MTDRFVKSTLLVLAGLAVGLAWPYLRESEPNEEKSNPTPVRSTEQSPAALPSLQVAPATPTKDRSASEKLLDECLLLAKTDIDAAFRKISGITPESYQSRLREGLATRLLTEDFSRVGQVAKLMKKSTEFQSAMARTVRIALKKDAKGTLQIINTQLGGDYRNHALRFAAQDQLDRKDFDSAVVTLNSMPASNERHSVVVSVAAKIGERGIDETLKWLDGLQTKRERETALTFVTHYFSEQRDTPALQRLFEISTDTEERKRLLAGIALQMRAADPQAAKDYVNSHHGPERDYAIDSLTVLDIVNNPALPFPEKVKQATALSSTGACASAIYKLISSETARDPQRTAQLVTGLPDESKKHVIGPLVQAWVRIDTDAALTWIGNLRPGKTKDSAITRAVEQLRGYDRVRAREVASEIGDPVLREKYLKAL